VSNGGYIIGSAIGAAAVGALSAFVGEGSRHPVLKSAAVMAAVGTLIAGARVGMGSSSSPPSTGVQGPPRFARFP
jgi:hypothetical protein